MDYGADYGSAYLERPGTGSGMGIGMGIGMGMGMGGFGLGGIGGAVSRNLFVGNVRLFFFSFFLPRFLLLRAVLSL